MAKLLTLQHIYICIYIYISLSISLSLSLSFFVSLSLFLSFSFCPLAFCALRCKPCAWFYKPQGCQSGEECAGLIFTSPPTVWRVDCCPPPYACSGHALERATSTKRWPNRQNCLPWGRSNLVWVGLFLLTARSFLLTVGLCWLR